MYAKLTNRHTHNKVVMLSNVAVSTTCLLNRAANLTQPPVAMIPSRAPRTLKAGCCTTQNPLYTVATRSVCRPSLSIPSTDCPVSVSRDVLFVTARHISARSMKLENDI